MPDDQAAPALKPHRPLWLPDTQGFLAIAIVVLVFAVVMTLLYRERINLDQNTFGALLTLLGVLAGCFKDVYSWAFGSSKKEEQKDDTIAAVALAPTPPAPAAAPTPDDLAKATLSDNELAFYDKLSGDDAKKAFLGMSAAERVVAIGKD